MAPEEEDHPFLSLSKSKSDRAHFDYHDASTFTAIPVRSAPFLSSRTDTHILLNTR